MVTELVTNGSRKTSKLVNLLKADIQRGRFSAGELMPAETELAKGYEVSRMTLRKALAALVETGEVVKLPHKGILVPREGEELSKGPAGTAETGRKLKIAMFWVGVPDNNSTQQMAGVSRYSKEQGMECHNYLSASNEEGLAMMERVVEGGADGILVYPYNLPSYISVLGKIIAKGFPVVSFMPVGDLALSSVKSEDGVGAYRAVHYLLQKYGRPVHYICESAGEDPVPEMFLAYRSAMADEGLEDLVESHTWRMDTHSGDPTYWAMERKWLPGYHIACKLLDRVQLPVSIFGENSYVGRGVYKAAAERNLTIGKDVCVIGLSDYPFTRNLNPPMTVLKDFPEKIGYEGAKLLHQIIEKKIQPPIHIRLPLELTIRGSG